MCYLWRLGVGGQSGVKSYIEIRHLSLNRPVTYRNVKFKPLWWSLCLTDNSWLVVPQMLKSQLILKSKVLLTQVIRTWHYNRELSWMLILRLMIFTTSHNRVCNAKCMPSMPWQVDPCCKLQTFLPTLARQEHSSLAASTGSRGFTTAAINAYLGTFASPKLFKGKPSLQYIYREMPKQNILDQLPPGCDRFTVLVRKGTGLHSYSHATCIKYSHQSHA